MTPFMAHKQFGDTYKWMLYGDDDTLFFMTGGLIIVCAFLIWSPFRAQPQVHVHRMPRPSSHANSKQRMPNGMPPYLPSRGIDRSSCSATVYSKI